MKKYSDYLLTGLRILVPWHFFYEGIAKLLTHRWSAKMYLMGSKWIFANFFHRMAVSPGIMKNVCAKVVLSVGLLAVAGWTWDAGAQELMERQIDSEDKLTMQQETKPIEFYLPQNKKWNADKVKTVVILGNSLVRVPPVPEIGWYGDWGMAASVRDSDFVHLLIRDIHQKNPSVEVKFTTIADFERGFDTYPLSNLDSLRNPDMLILKIGENVNDKKALEDNFISYYDKLVKYIAPKSQSIKVIVDGFWAHDVNRLIKEYAIKNNYLFVTTTSLSNDTTNTAKGKFTHVGVAGHPSDRGMRMIEQKIWNSIKDYFERK